MISYKKIDSKRPEKHYRKKSEELLRRFNVPKEELHKRLEIL